MFNFNNFNFNGLTMPAPLWGGWQSRIMVVAVLQRLLYSEINYLILCVYI